MVADIERLPLSKSLDPPLNQTPKETSHETDTNRFTFSLISGIDIEKSCCFFSCRVKIPYQQLIIFLGFIIKLQYERIIRLYYSSIVS